MRKNITARKIIVEQGKSTGRAATRTRRQVRLVPIPSLVPPGARKPKGAINVDAGARSTFRGRQRADPQAGNPIVRSPSRV